MWECHFLLTHVCDCLQSFFPGKRDKDVLGIHKRKETNVCCVQLNVGVSHKFSVCVCVWGGGRGVIQTRRLLSYSKPLLTELN